MKEVTATSTQSTWCT